jgi:O-antigen/teichoic acid export membrane protein
MSLKNVFWNFMGVLSSGLLIIVITPLYINNLGLERYGILSLWLILQVLMGVLDLGFGATLVKELAKTHKLVSEKIYERDLLKTLEFFYWLLSIVIMFVLILISSWISNHWLKIEKLHPKDVSNVLVLMAVSLGLQFPFSLYSNGLSGLQKQFKLNIIIIIGNLLRHTVGVTMIFVFNDLAAFFIAQIIISLVITASSGIMLWKNLPSTYSPKVNLKILSSVSKFSFGMALTTIVSVIMANADRIILSKMTVLSDLGLYAIAFTATGLLQLVIQPFYRTYYPVYSEVVSNGNESQIQNEYFESTKLFSTFFFPISLSAIFFAPQLFHLWLGVVNPQTVLIFRLLIVGITFSGLTWLPVAFQQANGWATLHFSIITISLVIGIPVSIFCIHKFGVVGATSLWLIHGFLDFTVCVWLMHQRFLIGKYFLWLKESVLFQFLVSFTLLFIFNLIMPQINNNFFTFLYIAISGLFALSINLLLRKAKFFINR